MSGLRLPVFVIILVLYLGVGLLYVRVTPAWQAPDEPAHYNYVRHLAGERTLPVLTNGCYDENYLRELTTRRFPPGLSVDSLCYENHQPPLYYLLSTPLFVLSGGSLPALRLFSVVLGAGVVIFAYGIGQTIFPERPGVALGTMAFVAFVPMHMAILASVNNDALAELVIAVLLFLLVRRLKPVSRNQGSAESGQDLLLGLVLGIGLVTKMTIYMAGPLVAVTLWLTSRNGRPSQTWRRFIQHSAVVFGLAGLIALPWYLRNASVYGLVDIFGLIRHDLIVEGQLRTGFYLGEVGLIGYLGKFVTVTFRSFWGQFGWMAVPMDRRTYQLLAMLTLTALGGLVAFMITDTQHRPYGLSMAHLRRLARWIVPIEVETGSSNEIEASSQPEPPAVSVAVGQQQALLVMALALVLIALAYGWYNLSFVQFQGRYLFPALIPLGLFFSLGLDEAFAERWRWWLASGWAVGLLWISAVSLLDGGLDKWGVLIVAVVLGALLVRARFGQSLPRAWPVALCFAALALLTWLSPFWFVIPYL